jgi:hypothetical protein
MLNSAPTTNLLSEATMLASTMPRGRSFDLKRWPAAVNALAVRCAR